MYCLKCGNKLEDGSKYCTKCGYHFEKNNDILGEKSSKKTKRKSRKGIIIVFLLVVFIIAVFVVAKGYKNYIDGYRVDRKIGTFTNTRAREAMDLDIYGKETPEELVINYVQAACDNDSERLLHLLPPDMLNNLLDINIGVDDYSTILTKFDEYRQNRLYLATEPAEIWECSFVSMDVYGKEALDNINSYFKSMFTYGAPSGLEISEARKVEYMMTYDERDKWIITYICKINGRWYVNFWMPPSETDI